MVKDGLSLFVRTSANFIANAPGHLSAISGAIDASDAERLMQTTHQLRGSALNLGLPRLGAVAFKLEEQGQAGVLVDAPATFKVLAVEMRYAVTALEVELAARK
jgi:HPt (histidine-containing phosphotransfer) domain-containing protein